MTRNVRLHLFPDAKLRGAAVCGSFARGMALPGFLAFFLREADFRLAGREGALVPCPACLAKLARANGCEPFHLLLAA